MNDYILDWFSLILQYDLNDVDTHMLDYTLENATPSLQFALEAIYAMADD